MHGYDDDNGKLTCVPQRKLQKAAMLHTYIKQSSKIILSMKLQLKKSVIKT